MNTANITLATNASSTGSAMSWPGGRGLFTAEAGANWGGGTAKVQFKTLNSTTWVDVPGASLTADGAKDFWAPPGEIRVDIATATTVYAYAHPYRSL